MEQQGPPGAYVKHGVRVPRLTHTRVITCEQAECEAHRNGWKTVVDVSTELGARQSKYITEQSGRKFEVRPHASNTLLTFTFFAGQQCFREHREQLTPGIYLRKVGTGAVQQLGEQAWADDLGETQEKFIERLKRERS